MPKKNKKAAKKAKPKKKSIKKNRARVVKKPTKRKLAKKAIKKAEAIKEKVVGEVTHYYSKIGVAVVKAKDSIKIGDEVHIKGAHADFKQKVSSMQINHKSVSEVKKGEECGMKVNKKVREGYLVYK